MNSFIFFLMIHEETRYTWDQSYRQRNDDTIQIMEMKIKLYLQTILLINYMMKEDLFAYVD